MSCDARDELRVACGLQRTSAPPPRALPDPWLTIMLDLVFLRTFLAIYRTGSITKAAKALHLTQPAVSQHLKALEVQVGGKLFRRHARGVVATPTAQELNARIGQHLDALQAVGDYFLAGQREARGILHFGAPVDLLAGRIVPALAGRLDPLALRLIFHPASEPDLTAMLREGELDVIFTTETPPSDVHHEAIFREEHALFVGVRRWQEIAALGVEERAANLVLGPFVSYAHDMPEVRELFLSSLGVELHGAPSVIVPDHRAVAAAVRSSRCVAALPRYVAEPLTHGGELFEVTLGAEHSCDKQVWLAARPGSKASPRWKIVRAALRDAFHGECGADGASPSRVA